MVAKNTAHSQNMVLVEFCLLLSLAGCNMPVPTSNPVHRKSLPGRPPLPPHQPLPRRQSLPGRPLLPPHQPLQYQLLQYRLLPRSRNRNQPPQACQHISRSRAAYRRKMWPAR